MRDFVKKETGESILPADNGCDFVITPKGNKSDGKIKLLQITDMQFIDSLQRRTPDRLTAESVKMNAPENFDIRCGNQIRALVTQTTPDLIFITGDIIYGSFDDNGTVLEWFCSFMDSLEIPWAPVFGNHDNESKMGVKWQCELLEKSKWCVFKRGTVTGNGNYTIGISDGNEIIRVLHMLDSNGCGYTDDPDVIKTAGIYPDQRELMRQNTKRITKACNRDVPAFCAFHIPTDEFTEAEINAGYVSESRKLYTIGVDVPKKGDDFGFKMEEDTTIKTDENFVELLKECNVEAVFVGHCHNNNTCIRYKDIRWVYGLKTGLYDYHIRGQVGGTLVVIDGSSYDVMHIPALVPTDPYA